MVKKFTINCDFGGQFAPVTFYIGDSAKGTHPLGFQNRWLSNERGGAIPQNIMDALAKLKESAEANNVSFEELCSYVIDEINLDKKVEDNMKTVNSKNDNKK